MMFKIYRSTNHEIHYLMSYIGGCMEVMSFIYLYKALIGFMTSNMVFGITSLARLKLDFESIYHILIILIWLVISAIHQIIEYKYINKIKSRWHIYAMSLTINCILLILFIIDGNYMLKNNLFLNHPTMNVMPLVTIGLLFMYIQNFIIKSGGTKYPTSTSVVTSVYILMMTTFCQSFLASKSRDKTRLKSESIHYFYVIAHFFVGAFITAILNKYISFYALLIPLLVLIAFSMKIWLIHKSQK
ncbi:YoaK family protein [Klebsiella quasipneumoniae]|uniref:YoaK family protein n=1 Tax=Klebsiella quasipneumoniae TaxID=1463165 RepID=UPI0012B8B311|nr:YoaK family protein [Klebsiella quasipneumoniae]